MNHKFFILYLFYICLFHLQIMCLSIKLLWFSENREASFSMNFFNIFADSPNEMVVFLLSWVLLMGLSIFLFY